MNDQNKNSQQAENKDVSVSELLKKDTYVNIKTQRFLNDLSTKDIEAFNENILKGRIHQNITLVDTEKCFNNTKDVRWSKFSSRFLIQDGQHRLSMIQRTVNDREVLLENEQKYLNQKLPVRYIISMGYDDLGETFVANNSGTSPTRQDKLTYLNTKMGDHIVDFCYQHKETLSKLYGAGNAGRRQDNRLRIATQISLDDKKISSDYSYEVGKQFYQTHSVTSDITNFQNLWIMTCEFANMCSNKSNNKQYVSLSPFWLREILKTHNVKSKNGLNAIFNQFLYVHNENKNNNKTISYTIKADKYSNEATFEIPYVEAIQDRGIKYYNLRSTYFKNFVKDNILMWENSNYICKKH